MTYTAEQLREWARDWDETRGKAPISEILRAHADALEENKRLNKWADGMTDAAIKERKTAEEYQRELRAELAKLRQHAEAMFNWITGDGEYCAIKECEACAIGRAYRADFPEEK